MSHPYPVPKGFLGHAAEAAGAVTFGVIFVAGVLVWSLVLCFISVPPLLLCCALGGTARK